MISELVSLISCSWFFPQRQLPFMVFCFTESNLLLPHWIRNKTFEKEISIPVFILIFFFFAEKNSFGNVVKKILSIPAENKSTREDEEKMETGVEWLNELYQLSRPINTSVLKKTTTSIKKEDQHNKQYRYDKRTLTLHHHSRLWFIWVIPS